MDPITLDSAHKPLHRLPGLIVGRLDPRDLVGGDWPTLVDLALGHGVAPMLQHALRRANFHLPQDDCQTRLDATLRQSAIHFLLFSQAQVQINQALTEQKIPAIWLKGMDLARTAYDLPALRPMEDMDVLVPYEQRAMALALMLDSGYQHEQPALTDGYQDLIHHYALRGPGSGSVTVEIHYRLLGAVDRLLPLPALAWFWEQGQSRVVEELTYTGFSPEAHLLYLCAHAVLQHGEGEFRLLRYLDLYQLVTHNPSMDWDLIINQAVVLGWTYGVARALSLSEVFFGAFLPANLLRDLEIRRPADENINHVISGQQSRNPWEKIRDRSTAMSWPDRIRYMGNLILPSPAYMAWRYGADRWWQLPRAYLTRWRKALAQFAVALRRQVRRG